MLYYSHKCLNKLTQVTIIDWIIHSKCQTFAFHIVGSGHASSRDCIVKYSEEEEMCVCLIHMRCFFFSFGIGLMRFVKLSMEYSMKHKYNIMHFEEEKQHLWKLIQFVCVCVCVLSIYRHYNRIPKPNKERKKTSTQEL